MAASDPVVRIRPEERTEGDATPGLVREQALAVEDLWSGVVRTTGHSTSGWHHHGEHDTLVFILKGMARMECGPGGATVVDATPGDFLHVPKGAIHRESNPGAEENEAIVVRAGHGPPVVNVDEPAPA